MKKVVKNNLLQIIIFVALIAIGIYYLFFDFKPNYIDMTSFNEMLKNTNMCASEKYQNTDFCIEYLTNGKVVNHQPVLDIFFNVIEYSPLGYLNILAAFILGIVSIKNISKILNSRFAKYYLTREDYSSFKKRIFISILKYIIYFPLMYLILYIICCFLGNWDLTGAEGFDANILVFGSKTIIIYLLNAGIMSLIYLLISIITVRIVNNYYLGIVLNYLIYFGLSIFMEIYIRGIIFYGYFSLDTYSYFLFFNAFNLRDIPNLFIYFGVRILVAGILFIISLNMYKDKESFVKYLEKKEVVQ